MVFAALLLGPLAGLVIGVASRWGCGLSWLMFSTQGVMLDPSFPLVGLALVYASLVFFQFLITDADKRKIRRAFGDHVAAPLAAQRDRKEWRAAQAGR